MSGGAKQFFYTYNGDQTTGETLEDPFGEIAVPDANTFIVRNGKQWKVVHVTTQTGAKNEWPVVRVSLSDSF